MIIVCPFCRGTAVSVPTTTRHVGYHCRNCGESFVLPPTLGCDLDRWHQVHPVDTPKSERIKLSLICESAYFLSKTRQINKSQWNEFAEWSAGEHDRIDAWEDEWNRPLLEELLRDVVI